MMCLSGWSYEVAKQLTRCSGASPSPSPSMRIGTSSVASDRSISAAADSAVAATAAMKSAYAAAKLGPGGHT